MKIAVLTTCYNEEKILPFFLSHYKEWDDILVLLDRETTDKSKDVCKEFRNVTVEECGMTAGLQELEKVAILQEAFNRGVGHFDFIAVLDSDELIVPFYPKMTAHEFLEKNKDFDVLYSIMFPVYRHISDYDLNPLLPALGQRLHGRKWRSNEVKPNVLRSNQPRRLTIGMHTAMDGMASSVEHFVGAHWADADPWLSVERRINRRNRFSEANKKMGWGVQHFNVTEESILEEAAEHYLDPLLQDLVDRI